MAERTSPGTRVAFTIAGSDPSGGAGVQADLKTLAVMGVYGAAALTCLTAQNTRGVRAVKKLDPEFVEQQIDAVASDIKIDATKIGMLGSAEIANAVAAAVKRNTLAPLVLDPVMVAKSGDSLIDDAAVAVIKKKLFPLAAVVTPNRHEAARLLGLSAPIADAFAASNAARDICVKLGAAACLVKGVKRPDDKEGQAVDVFFDGKESHEFTAEYRNTTHTHGSGCTLSAAIAGALALGQPLPDAIRTAKNLVSESIRQATDLGNGNPPVNHLAWLNVKK